MAEVDSNVHESVCRRGIKIMKVNYVNSECIQLLIFIEHATVMERYVFDMCCIYFMFV